MSYADDLPRVSIVVRTCGDAARGPELRRAVRSIVEQRGIVPQAIVAVNGRSYDARTIDWIARQPNTLLDVDPDGDKRSATLRGRELVTGRYFGYLDDDDELLPGALAMRAALLDGDPALDCVATNGEYITHGECRPALPNPEIFRGGLCRAILHERTWLASGGAIFRTATVGPKYFANLAPHREWTLIAFRVASERTVRFIDTPTYRIHDTNCSESKKPSYAAAKCEVLHAIEQWLSGGDLVSEVERAWAAAYHHAASHCRVRGERGSAWAFHLRSLRAQGGWRYLPYTALLLCGTHRPVGAFLSAGGNPPQAQ